MERQFPIDILIVGAGPAGMAAASLLVKSGAKVTIIDRDPEPGGKACAGGLTKANWPLAGLDPHALAEHATAYRELVVKTRFGSVSLRNPMTDLAVGPVPMIITIDRKAWAKERLGQLRDLGAQVRLGERLIGFDKLSVTTNRGCYRVGFMVGADGPSSRIRRRLGLPTGLKMRAFQMRVPTQMAGRVAIENREPTIWFDSTLFGSGYAWSFPAKGELRLGCTASAELRGAGELKKSFRKWLSTLEINTDAGRLEAGNIGCGYQGHRFGRIFLAGDAAGIASPVTGEGIGGALISGEEVAREIVDPRYRSASIAALAAKHRRTHDILLHRNICGPLYAVTSCLLTIPWVRTEAISRYIA
ncbi:MAG: NAD(P)-binding protein [Proteobacteria bacterium]|nr:NAD(P)-binding protein [Pseudomonadota bacterium]